MLDIIQMYQGNVSDDIIVRCSNKNGYYMMMDSNWTCNMNVVYVDSEEIKIQKALTLDASGLFFKGVITPEESLALAVGRYDIDIQLVNISLGFTKDILIILDVKSL